MPSMLITVRSVMVAAIFFFLVVVVLIRFSSSHSVAETHPSSNGDDGAKTVKTTASEAAAHVEIESPFSSHHENAAGDAISSTSSTLWQPSVCMPGTQLTSAKIIKACQSGQVVPREVFCKSKKGSVVCGQHSAGKMRDPMAASSRSARPSCASSDDALHDEISPAHWYFDKHDILQQLAPSSSSSSPACLFRYRTPKEIFDVLYRATYAASPSSSSTSVRPLLLFSGDSMMRQLFLRLISLLRGQLDSPLSEHYFHFDAVYFLFPGGEAEDVLVPLNPAHPITTAESVPVHLRSRVADEIVTKLNLLSEDHPIVKELRKKSAADRRSPNSPPLTMVFQWETKPSKFRKDFLALRPRVHVAAWMYWWQKRDPLSDFDAYGAAMDKYHHELWQQQQDKQSAADSGAKFIYVTTPWTRDGVFGGVDDKIRVARNTVARKWLFAAPRSSSVQRAMLDYSGIAALKKLPKTPDEIHYMCIWTKKLPELVSGQKSVPQNKCVDRMNAAVAQMLVHILSY